jgi:two-component system response regulator HydG
LKTVYLIDDDVFFNQTLKKLLEKKNYNVESFYNSVSFFEHFKNHDHPDLIVTDYRLPELDGLQITQKIKKINSTIPVILITNYGNIQTAVKSIKLGAFEFVSKPINPSEFLKIVHQALKTNEKRLPENKIENNFIKGTTTKKIWSQVDIVAPTNLSVLITGESGTGKELVAKYIHQNSKRKDSNFVAVDCGAIPDETAISELFGHEKGAFTGASQTKIGHFQYANNGTIFLDEIGNLSYDSQVILLRTIQERKIRRLGSNKDIDIDVRIIAATNENLEKNIENNNFRLDLFYRLNEFPITLPPLRERQEDLNIFIDFFGKNAAEELNKEYKGIDNNLLQDFKKHSWPGNLRELKNFIKRGVLLSENGVIKKEHLAGFQVEPISHLESKETQKQDLKSQNEELEKKMIQDTLTKYQFNKTKTAKKLGITRATLYKKIKLYNLD